jgi:uncharacterized protein
MGNGRRPQRIIVTIVGLLFWLVATFLPIRLWSVRLFGPLYGGTVLWWLLAVALCLYVLLVERHRLSSIGFRRVGWLDVLAGIVTGIVGIVGTIAIYVALFPALRIHPNNALAESILRTPFAFRVVLVTQAAVVEEILFRGYPIERIQALSGSAVVAGVLAWAAFTYAHLGVWGPAQLVVAGFGGLLLTLLYFWRRNLWANMIAHWMVDGFGFLLAG